MKVVKTVQEMRSISDLHRANGQLIRLVPTMGALHSGHAFLIQRATKDKPIHPKTRNLIACSGSGDFGVRGQREIGRENNVIVVVSIFVNPLQFNNSEDFSKYPNKLQADLNICQKLDVDYVFTPALNQMYPDSDLACDRCMICPAGDLADILEGISRPGHFQGMLTVVGKLFNIARPHEAYFGEKDYQQLLLVSRMCDDLSMDVRVVPVETVRDEDMLPLSSRNIRLKDQQRQVAPVMYEILHDTKRELEKFLKNPRADFDRLTTLNTIIMASVTVTLGFNLTSSHEKSFDVDYLELRCSQDLSEIIHNQSLDCFDCKKGCVARQVNNLSSKQFRTRLLISVVIDDIRLLDNIEVLLNT